MTFTAYRALFEDKPLVVSPAGGEDQILNGTPLVEVTIGQDSISVNILDSTPSPVLRRAAMVYEVVDIPGGDYLNVRSGPGSTYPIIGRLAPGTGDISSTAAGVKNGETTWLVRRGTHITAGESPALLNRERTRSTE
jgi:hypothetical protein